VDPRAYHLPDLPNAGYATAREKALSDAIMQFMREIERDRVRLLTIVLEGREKWRRVAGDIWSGFRIGQEIGLLDSIYDYFTLQAVPIQTQRALLKARQNPAKWQDILRLAWAGIERDRETLLQLQGAR
jgi:hypothetical protein